MNQGRCKGITDRGRGGEETGQGKVFENCEGLESGPLVGQGWEGGRESGDSFLVFAFLVR